MRWTVDRRDQGAPLGERALPSVPVRLLVIAVSLLLVQSALAQVRPYIGYVYPAGGQQGSTFLVRLGGQGLDDLESMLVTGPGITTKVIQYNRPLGAQETQLLNEQARELRRASGGGRGRAAEPAMMMESTMMMEGSNQGGKSGLSGKMTLLERVEQRLRETVNRPASAALAGIAYVQVTIAQDAAPGQRELRLATARGVSNPLVFHVGQLPETSRKAMVTTPLQVLGKEEQALRRRPAVEAEESIRLPCTMNGQVASGEINRYRFNARKGQQLVITTQARQLIPFIADAVPGWFQPVLALYNSKGKEVAYGDDYRFKPDPALFFQVPEDGEYVLDIHDAIYRGREDFVYRITIGEMPFVTSRFPLGAQSGKDALTKIKGWNLVESTIKVPTASESGACALTTTKEDLVSNPLPFSFDPLPDAFDEEPNNAAKRAQKITLPVVVNGIMDQAGDMDVFAFAGKSNETVVAAVDARRLDSPLDSALKITDVNGNMLAFNDDCEDPVAGANTHHADSYVTARLPADGTYYIHLWDTSRMAGYEYGYRLRVSEPRPDFELRVVPSSLAIRGRSSATVNVHLLRKEGFTGPVKLALKDAPRGFTATPVTLSGTQAVARITLRADMVETPEPISLTIAGTARIGQSEVTRDAVAAEDRMQAFLWRHLVPASEFKVLVYSPSYQSRPRRVAPTLPAASTNQLKATLVSTGPARKVQFTKQQVAGRLRQLKLLYEEGLLTDDFYLAKVAECEEVRLN